MLRPPKRLLALAGLAILIGSCKKTDSPTDPTPQGPVSLSVPVNPVLVPSPANEGAAPINRIEVTIVTLPDSTVLGTITANATPGSTDWDVSVTGSTEATSLQVAVTVELINSSGGTETVQFSGFVSPISISPSGSISAIEIPLVRGPLANVFATGVSVDVAPDSVEEGEVASISASATTSGSTPPTVFWTVLDTLVLTATDSTVTGVLAGTTQLIASAGRFSDTTTVVVSAPPPPTDLMIAKSVDTPSAFEGDSITFELVVTNPSTNELIDVPVVDTLPVGLEPAPVPADATWDAVGRELSWSVDTIGAAGADTLMITTSIALGTAGTDLTNTASVSAPAGYIDPDLGNNTDSTTVTVAQRSVDVRVAKTVDEPSPLPDSTVTFTVTVANDGAFEATDVRILDVLDTLFISPSHTPSVGSLDGDTIWTIPTIAPGDSATWTTTATVASTAGGESVTNSAILLSLVQNDTTPANDTATVAMTFPVSALPEVSITAPLDSAVFDPGDQVTFTGTASDLEDGDLSSTIVWTSNLDGTIGTGASVSSDQLGTGVHTIEASVTDSDGGEATDTITITVALYSVPLTLNVPFSGQASLPITLSEPAPTGGVTLTVAADDPSITTPTTPSIFIMEGAQSSNATLEGLSPGTTTVRVSNAQFGVVTSTVDVTAELDILGSAITMAPTFVESITIQFESLGAPIAAPGGGLDVTLTSRDPTCVSVPGTVTIPEGLINETAEVTYGGSASLTCETYVVASATSVVPDSVLVSVVPAPTINIATRTVGSGLQNTHSASLPLGNHGGVTVTVTSSDPSTLLIAPDANTPGTTSIDVQVADGSQGVSYYIQGVEGLIGTVTPTVTVSAPGFTDGSNTVSVIQPGIILSGAPVGGTTTLSDNSNIYAQIGIPSGNGVAVQNIRAGGTPVTVTFTSSDVGVGTLTDGVTPGPTFDRVIPVGEFRTPTTVATGGIEFDPIATGTVTLTADATAQDILMQPTATRSVTVSAPGINIATRTVGSGLQNTHSASLGAGNHGGVTVTVTSSDPSTLLIAPDANTPGTTSIDVQVADGSQGVSYYIQGVEGLIGTVTPTVTVSAPGFTDGSNTVSVIQPGIILSGAPVGGTTTLSDNSNIYAQIGIPSGNGVAVQNIRAGGTPVTVTFTSSDVGVGTLTDGVTPGPTFDRVIPVGEFRTPTTVATGGIEFDPIATGTVTLTADATAQDILMQPTATRSVTVSAPGINIATRTVGSGLQNTHSASLGAGNHGGVTVTVTSSDPSTLLIAPDANTPGTTSIDVQVADGSQGVSYYIQGVEGLIGTVTPTVTVSAPGFTDGSNTVSVIQPGIILSGAPVGGTTTLSDNSNIYAQIGIPSGNGVAVQNIRAGGTPVTVTFTSSDVGVGTLTDGVTPGPTFDRVIPVGEFRTPTTVATGGIEFDPIATGTVTLTADATAQDILMQPTATRSVTVSAPTINIATRTVGSGLQNTHSASLGAGNHGGVTVTVTSSDPSTLLIAPDANTPGTTSIDVQVADGSQGVSYYIQGVEGLIGTVTPTVTVSAPGFTDGSNTVSVVQPGIILSGMPATTSAGADNSNIYAQIGIPSGNGVAVQNIRAGGTPVTVTFTSSDVGVGTLTDGVTSGATFDRVIPVGEFRTPTTVAAGGIEFDPIAAGTVTVTADATAQDVLMQPTATRTATITP